MSCKDQKLRCLLTRLLSQTSADLIQGDLNCFGDWAISSAADIALGRAAQMGAILTGDGYRISGGLTITEFL